MLTSMGSAVFALALIVASPALAAEAPGAALTLDDAVQRALHHAFGLRLERESVAGAQSSLRAAENAFDFKLTASFRDGHALQRNGEITTPLGVVTRDFTDESQGFTFRMHRDLRIGGSVELRSDLTRRRTRGEDLDPLHAATTSATWSIPLWGGRGKRVATAPLVSAETGFRQATRSLVASEMSVVVNVVRSFYQVLRRESIVSIDRDAVQRARDNHRTYELRLAEGLVTEIDVKRASRELTARENAVVTDEEALASARDNLLLVLGGSLDEPLDPVGEPVFEPVRADLDAAIAEALGQRADLRSAREDLELAQLDAAVARSATRPDLDLQLSAGVSSVDGDAASKWFDLENDDRWAGGLALSYTFGERADNEALVRALIGEQSARLRLEDLHRQVTVEVRDAVRGVRSLERQIELLRANVDLARESLRLAQLQLEEDLIRTTDLLQIQDEMVRAETDLVNALYDHATARVALDLALGRYRVGNDRPVSAHLRSDPRAVADVPVLPLPSLSGASTGEGNR